MHDNSSHSCTHDHTPGHAQAPHIHPVVDNLRTAFFLNLTFTVIELIGGIFTNSVAILSDASHDLGDSIAIGSSLWMEKVSRKPRTRAYTYGYKRFSPLAALLSTAVLVAGSLGILFHAVPRILNPQAVQAQGMLAMAILGVVFNGLAVLKLKRSGHSVNQKAVMLHLLEDALGWIAVLLGSVIIALTDWYWIDPLLSILIALFILYNASKTLRQVMRIFLQVSPVAVDQEKVFRDLMKLHHVKGVHDFHSWTLDGNLNVSTLHLVIDESASMEDQKALRQAVIQLLHRHQIHHPTIHLEYPNEECGLIAC